MIQEFSVQNFLSFKEKETISFIATADKNLLDELTFETKPNGIRLLRMALIYGANASGKSNLLQAIQTVWSLLFSPQEKEHEEIGLYAPFELTKKEPTHFEIIFWTNGRKYSYEIIYNKYSIIYEKMMYSSDKDVLSLMYERKKGQEVRFGSTLAMKAKQKDELTKETLHNHTLLSTLNKKNIDVPHQMKELYEWIKNHVHELGIYNDSRKIAEQAEENPKLKNTILTLLNKADFNISDFHLIEITFPKEMLKEIQEKDNLPEKIKEQLLRPHKEVLFIHSTDEDSFSLSFNLESSGTKMYFRLARLLFDLNQTNCIIMEDELEDSLHYDLLLHYLQTYIENTNNSQLIFTTHNQQLLNENWLIRRDMIWFTEKDPKTSSTTLFRASDMGIHKNVSLMNAYKIGKLGGKPTLGSTLLNFDEE